MPTIQGTINELWRPVRGPLVAGFNQITDEFKVLKRLTGFTPLSPREMKFPVDLRFGGGTGWTTSGGSTMRASNNAPKEAVIAWNHLAGRIDIDYDMADAATNNRFRRAELQNQLAWQGMDKIRSFKRAIAWFFWGKPDGVVCKINSAAGAPTYTVKDRYGVTGLDATPAVEFLVPGIDYVAIIDPAGPTVRDIQLVVATTPGSDSFELAAAIPGAAANDLVVLANHLDDTTTDYGLALTGLREHKDNTSFQGIAEADYPEWTYTIENAAYGAALSGKSIFSLLTQVERRSGLKPNLNFTTVGVITAAGGAQLSQIRYQGQQDTLEIGFERVKTQGMTLNPSDWCPAGEFWADSDKSLFKVTPGDEIEKVKEGNAELHYYRTQLGFFTDFLMRCDLARKNRASGLYLGGVTEE